LSTQQTGKDANATSLLPLSDPAAGRGAKAGSTLTMTALTSHNLNQNSATKKKKYSSKSSRTYSSFGGEVKSKSLMLKRVPTTGVALMSLLASSPLFLSLELSDEESVKADAVSMKRRQMEEIYDSSLTGFVYKDLWSILCKTWLSLILLFVHLCSTFIVFPVFIYSLPLPLQQTQPSVSEPQSESFLPSIITKNWSMSLLLVFILFEFIGRHVSSLNKCCYGWALNAVITLLIILRSLSVLYSIFLAYFASGIIFYIIFTYLHIYIFIIINIIFIIIVLYFTETFRETTFEYNNWLLQNDSNLLVVISILGFTHSYLGTAYLLFINHSVEPYEKVYIYIYIYIYLLFFIYHYFYHLYTNLLFPGNSR
jgi:hypothetical protein